jgi:alpha-acetolactate decarboxylase
MSSRFQVINHKGKRIFYVDFKGIEIDEVWEVLEAAKQVIARQPMKSVRHLTDVTGTVFSKRTIRELKAYANHNEPFIHRSAAIGVSGIMVVMFNAVVKFSKRKNLVLKRSREEALDWLAEDE